MGSGDPSSGHICNRVSKYWSARLNKNTVCCVWLHMHVPTYWSQTEQWWHRSGFSSWQRSQKRMAEETHRGQFNSCLASPNPWPESNKLHIILEVTSVLCSVCTSRVGAGVDWQVLGYSPQDLLLGLLPILPLQQLFVRVGQMKLCGAEHTNNTYYLIILLIFNSTEWYPNLKES